MEGNSAISAYGRTLPDAFWKMLSVVSLVIGLSACSTVELVVHGNDMTEDEKLVREQSFDFVLTNVIEGAVVVGTVGCVVGAVTLAVASQSGGDLVTACLALGAIGAVAGGVDGYSNAAYANANAREVLKLRQQAEEIVSANDELLRRIAASRRVLVADRRRLRGLGEETKKKWYEFELARSEREKIVANNAAIQRVIETAREQLDEYETGKLIYPPDVAQRMRKSISTLRAEVMELEAKLVEASTAMHLAGLS
jgi:hypothetical protein